MKKLVQRIRDLRADAEDCMLIGQLATSDTKEKIFKERARHLLEIATALEKVAAGENRRGLAYSHRTGPQRTLSSAI